MFLINCTFYYYEGKLFLFNVYIVHLFYYCYFFYLISYIACLLWVTYSCYHCCFYPIWKSLSLSESFHPFTLNIISNIFGLKYPLIMYILFVESVLYVFCCFIFTSFCIDNFYDHIFPLFEGALFLLLNYYSRSYNMHT